MANLYSIIDNNLAQHPRATHYTVSESDVDFPIHVYDDFGKDDIKSIDKIKIALRRRFLDRSVTRLLQDGGFSPCGCLHT